MLLAVGTPPVLASGGVDIAVTEDESTYTVEVTHNGTAVNDSEVNVTATDPNATYGGANGFTDENGTVTFALPENQTEVDITATFENHSHTETFVLSGANDSSSEAEAPFGQLLTSWLHNLVDAGNATIIGQTVSEWVTANNPGSEHRSDKANPGGNGPPEHATNSTDAGKHGGNGNGGGPPDHANNDNDEESTATETPTEG